MVMGRLTSKHPIDKELKALLEATANMQPGDKLGPTMIEEVTELKRHVYPWQVLIGKFREQAFARGQFFKWRQTEAAYVILTADETVLECNRRQKCERKTAKRTGAIAGAIDDGELSDEAKALRTAIVNSATKIAEEFDKAIKNRRSLLKAFEPLPRIAKQA